MASPYLVEHLQNQMYAAKHGYINCKELMRMMVIEAAKERHRYIEAKKKLQALIGGESEYQQ